MGKGLQGLAISVRSGQAKGLFRIQRLWEVGKKEGASSTSQALMPCIELHTNRCSADKSVSAWAAALSVCSCEAKMEPQETPHHHHHPPLPQLTRGTWSTWEGLLLLRCLVSLNLWKTLGSWGAVGVQSLLMESGPSWV